MVAEYRRLRRYVERVLQNDSQLREIVAAFEHGYWMISFGRVEMTAPGRVGDSLEIRGSRIQVLFTRSATRTLLPRAPGVCLVFARSVGRTQPSVASLAGLVTASRCASHRSSQIRNRDSAVTAASVLPNHALRFRARRVRLLLNLKPRQVRKLGRGRISEKWACRRLGGGLCLGNGGPICGLTIPQARTP
jgi:hypothetical protein